MLEEKHHNNKKCAELEEAVSRLQIDIDKIGIMMLRSLLRCIYPLSVELRLQQQQRLANREKEHAIQQIQLERDELKQQLHHCQQQLRSLQADRSLLIVSFISTHTHTHMHAHTHTYTRTHTHTHTRTH